MPLCRLNYPSLNKHHQAWGAKNYDTTRLTFYQLSNRTIEQVQASINENTHKPVFDRFRTTYDQPSVIENSNAASGALTNGNTAFLDQNHEKTEILTASPIHFSDQI